MKKSLLAITFVIAFLINAIGQDTVKVTLKTAADSLSFSFGLLIGNNFYVQKVTDINEKTFLKGFKYGYADQKTSITTEQANAIVQDYFQKMISDESNANLEKSNAFLAENAKKEGVVSLPSGLQYEIVSQGSGDLPTAEDKVKVHYTGKLINGNVFDSSVERNEPAEFGVSQVIPGWTEALQLMPVGSKWILYIPPALAYGEKGAGGVIGPNEALIFEVELLEIVK